MSVLKVENLDRHFGGLAAVSGVSFTAEENEILSIIGPNGAGKTTVLNVISGFLKPSAGVVTYGGMSTVRLETHQLVKLGIARTFQITRLFKHLSVLDNVKIGMHHRVPISLRDELSRFRRTQSEEAKVSDAARALMEEFNIWQFATDEAGTLAYGTQRIVEIVRALASNPSLLLLDEPGAGMNHGEINELMTLVGRIRDKGLTVLLIEHNMDIVMNISNRIVVLDHGKKIAEGKPFEIQSDSRVIEAYLGRGAREDA